MKGLVVKNTGSWYTVRTDDGQLLDCKVKGNFRIKGIRSTNPVAVGDRVTLSAPTAGEGQDRGCWITDIEDRRNYIIRKSINLSKQSHILAANVDQAVLVVTVANPLTSTTFIDRFLASAEAYRVPVVLLFNKTDLLSADEQHYQQLMVSLYEGIGYQCLQISAATGQGLDRLLPLLHGKVSVLSGNSGVGKSTLINRLVPGVNLRTAELSDAHNMGQHTTTFSEMIPLAPSGTPKAPPSAPEGATIDLSLPTSGKTIEAPSGAVGGASSSGTMGGASYLIDTPGIKGFGSFDMEPEEIGGYFKEIFRFSRNCRFSNCTHTHEPGCAVLQAVEQHYIAQSRYQSYLSMLNDKDESKYREAY